MISYAYLWHRQHRAGQVEGSKNRPCAIVMAAVRQGDGAQIVTVAPITHTAPESPEAALEIPAAVKRHLGFDDERS